MATELVERLSRLDKDERTRIAYSSIEGIEFLEMNDGNRLGYHVYLYVNGEIPSLDDAIYEAKARTKVRSDELARIITERLEAAAEKAVA